MKKIDELMIERRSARAFDENYEIPEKDLKALTDSIRMAPSAWGLLTQRLIVIKNKEVKKELSDIFFNQLNFTSANVYMIFLGTTPQGLKSKIEKSLELKFGKGNESNVRTSYTKNIFNGLLADNISDEARLEFSIKQSFISVGVATAAAAALNIDTCVIQGFNQKALTEYLFANKITTSDEIPLITMACGKSIKVSGEKTRLSHDEFVIEL